MWKKAGVVVKESVNVADVRYAVLEALRTEGGSERFVVAYPNEDYLRDVIASSRIVEFGFSSREAAVASIKTRVSTTTKQKHVPRAMVVKRAEEHQHGLHWSERRPDSDPGFRLIRRFLVAFYNDAVAAAILIFSSRNIISSAIRTFLAVSF
jgi:hypothetical protein